MAPAYSEKDCKQFLDLVQTRKCHTEPGLDHGPNGPGPKHARAGPIGPGLQEAMYQMGQGPSGQGPNGPRTKQARVHARQSPDLKKPSTLKKYYGQRLTRVRAVAWACLSPCYVMSWDLGINSPEQKHVVLFGSSFD